MKEQLLKHKKLLFANLFVFIVLLQVIYFFMLAPKLKLKNSNLISATIIIQNTTAEATTRAISEQHIIDSIYNSLSVEEKAAQLIMVGTSEKKGIGIPFPKVKILVENNIAGNVLFLKGNSEHFKNQITELNNINNNQLKKLYACDCEPSLFHKKFTDLDSVPKTNELINDSLIDKVLTTINSKMNYMGLNINFAPVADIAVNQEIINNRSFSNNPVSVQNLSNYFIHKSKQDNIFCAVKHFPGHGAVSGDTHKESVYIDGQLTELETFKNIINSAQPEFVMMGHMAIINNSGYNTNNKPCSISKNIVTDLLKKEIGYNGIVITDAMNMQAVKKYTNADWQAVLAGNDMILMPDDAVQLHKKICTELTNNSEISDQLEISIKKVIKLKQTAL